MSTLDDWAYPGPEYCRLCGRKLRFKRSHEFIVKICPRWSSLWEMLTGRGDAPHDRLYIVGYAPHEFDPVTGAKR
jgi:hypothetical protein